MDYLRPRKIAKSTKKLAPEFEKFILERRYLKNVSPKTLEWYRESLTWLSKYDVSDDGLKNFVIGMREKGLKATSCNNRIRAVKAYLVWANLPLKLSYLKEEERVLPVLTPVQIALLIKFKPKNPVELRLHTLIMLLLDTGIRIEEALTIETGKVDFDNLLLTVRGKGSKERTIPFSFELRKVLYRYAKSEINKVNLFFTTRDGSRLLQRNVLRAFKKLCNTLGFEAPRRSIHSLRHTMACSYLKAGGNLFFLSRQLGHTSTLVTEGYLRAVQPQDFRDAHQRLSLLR